MAIIGSEFPGLLMFAINNYHACAQELEKHRDTGITQFNPKKNEKNWEKLIQQILIN